MKAFEPGSIVEVSVDGVGKAIRECVDEIASLRQQLAECQANLKAEVAYSNKTDVQLAESQAREQEAIRKMHEAADAHVRFVQVDHPAALDSAIRQAKREALLEAADKWPRRDQLDTEVWLRRMADNLKD